MAQSPEEITGLLQAWRNGNRDALDKLLPIVYDELRRIAHRYVRRQAVGQTLQTTAVVHEAYLRLTGQNDVAWQNRAHFYGVCAKVMRSLLVDRARARKATKRGGGQYKVAVDDGVAPSNSRNIDIVALDEALERLSSIDPRKARIVEILRSPHQRSGFLRRRPRPAPSIEPGFLRIPDEFQYSPESF